MLDAPLGASGGGRVTAETGNAGQGSGVHTARAARTLPTARTARTLPTAPSARTAPSIPTHRPSTDPRGFDYVPPSRAVHWGPIAPAHRPSGPAPTPVSPTVGGPADVEELQSLRDHARATSATAPPADPAWPRRYARLLLASDSVAIGLALAAAYGVSVLTGGAIASAPGVVLAALALGAALGWLVALALEKSRDRRIVGVGMTEYARVWTSSARLFGAIAIGAFVLGFDLARGLVAVAFPTGVALLLVARYAARRYLQSLRRRGRALSRIVLTGSRAGVAELVAELARTPLAGYVVVGACIPGGDPATRASVAGVPVLGDLVDVPRGVAVTGAQAVAVVGSDQMTASVLRSLGYQLEASGTDLIVAPGLVDVAGPRVVMSPAEGLSLVHVDAPVFSGVRYAVKSVLDWTLALVAVAILAVPLLVIGLSVALTSRGPVFFHQERVGRDGRSFRMIKFRSMRVGAEAEVAALAELNEGAGPLFKLRDDPRVTPLGRVLRRYSLDELPQLFNVLRGEMSLVGPRPPLPSEVASYDGRASRRMLVKPGLTGLWQVSGRSDLSWDEGLRKDVYYVENWTVLGDLLIMARTVRAMFGAEGAY